MNFYQVFSKIAMSFTDLQGFRWGSKIYDFDGVSMISYDLRGSSEAFSQRSIRTVPGTLLAHVRRRAVFCSTQTDSSGGLGGAQTEILLADFRPSRFLKQTQGFLKEVLLKPY